MRCLHRRTMWVLQTLVAALLLPGTPTRASQQQRVPASPRCEVAPEVAPKEKKILLPVFPEGTRAESESF